MQQTKKKQKNKTKNVYYLATNFAGGVVRIVKQNFDIVFAWNVVAAILSYQLFDQFKEQIIDGDDVNSAVTIRKLIHETVQHMDLCVAFIVEIRISEHNWIAFVDG